jgi:hypothetical protein
MYYAAQPAPGAPAAGGQMFYAAQPVPSAPPKNVVVITPAGAPPHMVHQAYGVAQPSAPAAPNPANEAVIRGKTFV